MTKQTRGLVPAGRDVILQTDKPSTGSKPILYQIEDGRTRMECRFDVSCTRAEHTALEVG